MRSCNWSEPSLCPDYPLFLAREQVYRALCLTLSDRADQACTEPCPEGRRGGRSVDWESFTPAEWALLPRMAEAEGVAPLLYFGFRNADFGLPGSVLAALEKEYYQTAASNALLFAELDRILQALDAAGVPVIVLKGAALAKTLYPDPALRPMNDLDLLVRRQDLDIATLLIRGLGYSEDSLPEMTPGFDRDFGHHFHLQSQGYAPTVVELHWNLIAGDNDRRAPPIDWFWSQTQPLQPTWTADLHGLAEENGREGGCAQTLNPQANLLYLSAHLALQHGGRQSILLWYYDLHLLVSRYREELDWDGLRTMADEMHWAPALCVALRGVQERFDTVIPAGFLEALANDSDPWMGRMVNRMAANIPTRAQNALSGVFSQNSWQSRLRYVWAHLCPSPAFVRQRYHPRPAWLWPLCYLYRWLDMLGDGLLTLYRMRPMVKYK